MKENNHVIFHRIHNYYYYEYGNITNQVTNESIKFLKENLELPFVLEFYYYSRAQICKVISNMLDNNRTIKVVRPTHGIYAVEILEKINIKGNQKIKS